MRRAIIPLLAVLGLVAVALISLAARSGGGATPRDPTGSAAPPGRDALTQESVLGRIREELAQAPPVRRRTDADRLADARAWIAANRPHDWPYAGVEAWMLAGYEAMADQERRTGAWVIDNARVEAELIRALDADWDGVVSDEEVEAFAAFSLEVSDPAAHPYVLAKLDANGDGSLDPEERAWIETAEANLARLEAVRTRAELDAWDADGNGALSEGERSAGERESLRHQRVFEDGHIEYVAEPDDRTTESTASAVAALRELYGEAIADQTLARQRVGAAVALTMPLTEAMSLVERDTAQHAAAPAMPDLAAFDPDGDNALDEQQLAAHMAAMQAWELELQRWRSREHAESLRRQFAEALAEDDADRDGKLMPHEWDARVTRLTEERDARLLLRHYDLDRNGRVGTAELDTYLRWYRAGSLRADANFDGRLDALDLETVAGFYDRTGG